MHVSENKVKTIGNEESLWKKCKGAYLTLVGPCHFFADDVDAR